MQRHLARGAAALFAVLGPCGASAQPGPSCILLCAPTLEVEPTISIGNIIARPLLQDVLSGERQRLSVEPVFQTTLALGIGTQLSWLAVTLETIYSPFVPDDAIEFEAELNLRLIDPSWMGGWFGVHADFIDQLSPRARPGASTNTHKLDVEVDVALHGFNWLPPKYWLHHLAFEASFDYLATGLPRRGDVMDGKLYLDDASAWSLSLLVVIPLAPVDRTQCVAD